jgi:hypothetical protein
MRLLAWRGPHARHAPERALADADQRRGVDDDEVARHSRELAALRGDRHRRDRDARESHHADRPARRPFDVEARKAQQTPRRKSPDPQRRTLCEKSDQAKESDLEWIEDAFGLKDSAPAAADDADPALVLVADAAAGFLPAHRLGLVDAAPPGRRRSATGSGSR